LFAAVEGEAPYGSDGAPLSTVKRMVQQDMVPMRNAGPLAPLLATMLAAEPVERPTAAGASRLLRELGGTVEPVDGPIDVPPKRRRSWLIAAAAAAVVVLALAGWLVWPKFGSATATTNPKPPVKTTVTKADHGIVVPNQTLVSPCGLMNANVLANYGSNVTLDPHYGNFERCDVLFDTNNTTVDVRVDFADPNGPPTGKTTVVVQTPQTSPGDCERTLVLSDGTQIEVDAAVRNGSNDPSGTIDFCGIDQVAAQYALGVLNHSGVPQVAPSSLRGSLASYNACRLVTPAQLSVVAGLDGGNPEPKFGDWECDWDGPNNLHVGVTFDQSQPPSSSDGQEVSIGSRAAYVYLDDGGCEADLVYRTYGIGGGKQIAELVDIEVDGNQPQSQQCGLAQVLAQDVGAQLH
jgi:hypothetical protein